MRLETRGGGTGPAGTKEFSIGDLGGRGGALPNCSDDWVRLTSRRGGEVGYLKAVEGGRGAGAGAGAGAVLC